MDKKWIRSTLGLAVNGSGRMENLLMEMKARFLQSMSNLLPNLPKSDRVQHAYTITFLEICLFISGKENIILR